VASVTPSSLADAARRLGAGNRRFFNLAALAGGVAILWVASRWAGGPTFITLYRDVDLAAMSTMTETLNKNNIQYRLEGGGSEVLVPVQDVARARVLLAKEGLPSSGHPGMELFDKPTWGMTDFTQRVTYRRALEGELSRTIASLDGVQRAEVHLALPEDSPLRRLSRPAEAAVVVSLRPGAILGAGIVQGITYIVSNSVEGLPAQNVAVVDATGRMLSTPADTGGPGLSGRQLDIQHTTEKELGDKVDALVATVLGAGHSRVQVSAKLNFDQTEQTVETYDPDAQVLNSEQRSEAKGDQTESGAGTQTVVSNTYSNSKKVQRTVGSTGTIGRLTVAVLVDQRALTKAVPGPNAVDSTMRSFDAAIRNAVGFDSTRGDRLTLTAMPFEIDTIAAKLPAQTSTTPPRDPLVIVERVSRPAVMLIGIALAFVLALRVLRQPDTVPADLAAEFAAAAARGQGIPGSPPNLALPAAAQQLRAGVRADLSERPAVAAQVMRAWIGEGT
jgi:flagellar M-ring protein FliF